MAWSGPGRSKWFYKAQAELLDKKDTVQMQAGNVNHHPINDMCLLCRSEDCQYAHAVPKDDGSAHARAMPRLKEVTDLVLAAHRAGRLLAPRTQGSRNGTAGGNPKWAKKARK
ncbi:hypothetical protein T492DRAFT_896685 [Pavlovales sp. CCMP2436]|nr:hypothetical protein T492DRAFT_896685 [Pavlovales sp. CCMP2436]